MPCVSLIENGTTTEWEARGSIHISSAQTKHRNIFQHASVRAGKVCTSLRSYVWRGLCVVFKFNALDIQILVP